LIHSEQNNTNLIDIGLKITELLMFLYSVYENARSSCEDCSAGCWAVLLLAAASRSAASSSKVLMENPYCDGF
jgi:hypothetical protein